MSEGPSPATEQGTEASGGATAAVTGPTMPASLRFPKPESLTKVAGAIALVCFVSGLLTVEAYLYNLGFSVGDLGVLKARLVYTGVGLLATVALALLCPVAAVQLAVDWWRRRKETSFIEDAQPLVAPVLFVLPAFLFSIVALPEGSPLGAGDSITLYALAATAGGCLLLCWFMASNGLSGEKTWAFLVLFVGLLAVFYVLWFISYYATTLYPRIPQEYGGGLPVRAWIEVDTADRALALSELGVLFDSPTTPRRSKPLELLHEDDKVIVVRATQGAIVRIQRSGVVAVRTDNRAPSAKRVVPRLHGATRGVPEPGDSILFVFSETIDPASILSGWNGSPTDVVVKVGSDAWSPGATVVDHRFRVVTPGGTAVQLGTVVVSSAVRVREAKQLSWGTASAFSTMVQRGPIVILTLGAGSEPWPFNVTDNRPRWDPSTKARDFAGYRCRRDAYIPEVSESRPPLF